MKTKYLAAAITSAVALLLPTQLRAQCAEILSGLRSPLGSTWTNQGNLLVAEAGNGTLHSGRISIVAPNGTRRTLLDGLPSAPGDVGDPSGPSGLAMRGRNLYLAIGVGDVAIRTPGLPPRTALVNPAGPSSPLFSSVLWIHFSAATEKTTSGFTLTPAHHQALAAGESVTFSNRGGDMVTIQMIADFPNFVPEPFPGFGPFPPVPDNIRVSNPFALIAEGSSLYVTDGGMNRVWQVDLTTGSFITLVHFPNLPNPLFGIIGYPDIEPVVTGLASDAGLLVALFGGFPFPPGASNVQTVDLVTGTTATFIGGRKSPIGVLPFKTRSQTSYLVLQYASVGPFFGSPGQVLRFDDPAGPPIMVANCLTAPTSITLNEKSNTLYVTEFAGRLMTIPFAP